MSSDWLSSEVLHAIIQTRNGYSWIRTDAGMNLFEGRDPTPILFSRSRIKATRHRRHAGTGPDGGRLVASHGSRWIGSTAFLLKRATP